MVNLKMDKNQLIIILESTLLSFDGLNEQEIKEMNPSFDEEMIKVGINLINFLKEKI